MAFYLFLSDFIYCFFVSLFLENGKFEISNFRIKTFSRYLERISFLTIVNHKLHGSSPSYKQLLTTFYQLLDKSHDHLIFRIVQIFKKNQNTR